MPIEQGGSRLQSRGQLLLIERMEKSERVHGRSGQSFEPPRIQILRTLQRAIDRGELAAALDRQLAVALLLGPPLYLHIRKLSTGEAPQGAPVFIVDAFMRALGALQMPSHAKQPKTRAAGPMHRRRPPAHAARSRAAGKR